MQGASPLDWGLGLCPSLPPLCPSLPPLRRRRRRGVKCGLTEHYTPDLEQILIFSKDNHELFRLHFLCIADPY